MCGIGLRTTTSEEPHGASATGREAEERRHTVGNRESLENLISRAEGQDVQDGRKWHSIVTGDAGDVVASAWLPSGSEPDLVAFAERELGIDMGEQGHDVTIGDGAGGLFPGRLQSIGYAVCDTNEPPTLYGLADTHEHARALALWVSGQVIDRRFGIISVA